MTQITSTVDLVKEYARQETVGHLKGIGRWVGFGLVGAIGAGHRHRAAGRRAAAADAGPVGDTFDGFWSIVPYLIALVVCILVVALALSRVKATDLHREGRE